LLESQLIINGHLVEMPPGQTFDRRDPASDCVITRAAAGRAEEAVMAVDAAAAAFPAWSRTAARDRGRILLRAAEIFREEADEVVAIAAEEIGSSPQWTLFNIDIARQILQQAATLADEIGEQSFGGAEQEKHYLVRRRPAGVVLGIAPWNAAVTLATRAVAAPLASANTAVLKASELCPKTHEWVARALCSAGLPPGVLNFMSNAPDHAQEVVEALIGHPAVRRINFTGSTRVGREIALVAARHLKRCLLELSGKGTMLVLADADLDLAVDAACHGSFFNQGQICMSTERIVIVDGVADAFLERFMVKIREAGTERRADSPGRMINPQAALRVRGLIDDAVGKGAVLVTGGETVEAAMRPAVLDHVSAGMRIYHEEAFGPIAAIVRVADAEEGISIVNDQEFGLVASVFSADADAALEIVRQFDTGIGHVNGSTVFDDPTMPFGGVKASGYGRFGGKTALEEFTDLQWITVREAFRGDQKAPQRASLQMEELNK
jgi:vanillin dehydrogenase